jgi:polyisoprenoid-binding protein YceI
MRTSLLLLILTSAAPVFGQPLVLQFDPVKTRVDYTLGDVLHTVHGTFHLKSGEIRVDPLSNAASGALVVDARSGESGSNGRDSRMHKNILESEKYPEISFVPDRVIGTVDSHGASDVQLHGVFTIHGAPHEMTVPVHAQFAEEHVDATAKFPVPYVKWGMKNPSTFVLRVSDTVQIDIHLNGRMVPPS